jgi:hypothetical protein
MLDGFLRFVVSGEWLGGVIKSFNHLLNVVSRDWKF